MTVTQIASFRGLCKFASGIVPAPPNAALPYLTALGLLLIALHPTIVSTLGPSASKVTVLIILLLLIPHLRMVNIPVFLSILTTSAYICVITGNIHAIVSGIIGYCTFSALTNSPSAFHRAIFFILIFSLVVAAFQVLMPDSIFNFHATAESKNNFLNQYRPTSMFPAQAYYNQFLFLAIPIAFLLNLRSPALMMALGSASAVSGSAAGLVLISLLLLLGDRHGIRFALIGFASTAMLMFFFYREIFIYNYSFLNIFDSFEHRISPANSDKGLAPALSSHPQPSISHLATLIGTQIVAIFGIMLITMMLIRRIFSLSQLRAFSASALAIMAAQIIHPTIGSIYFSLTLGVIAALIFRFLSNFLERVERTQITATNT